MSDPAKKTPTLRLIEHVESALWAARLEASAQLAIPWQGEVFRAVRMKYAMPRRIIDGKGAKTTGGRWNPPGIAVVYCSLGEATALAEREARHRGARIPLQQRTPYVGVGMRVSLERVLDFTGTKLLNALHLSADPLLEDWQSVQQTGHEALTQTLGRLAWQRGLDGLLVPSVPAQPNGANLVVLVDHARPNWCEIYNVEQLPKD